MNKTLSIGLAGFSFMIEEHAYIKLSDYLNALRSTLDASEVDEVMHDIEIRMVEIFRDSLNKREVINDADVEKVIAQIGTPEKIEEQEEAYFSEKTNTKKHNSDNKATDKKQLFRDPEQQKIAGVCSGLAHYVGMDVTAMRAIWLGILVLGIFTQAISSSFIGLIYIILWIILPKAETAADFLKMKGKPINFDNLKNESNKLVQFANESTQKVGEIYKENQPYITNAGNGIWNVIRYVLGAFFSFVAVMLLISSLFGMGLFVETDLPPFREMNFYFEDNNLSFLLSLIIILGCLIPAILFGLLATKLISPKTKLKNIGWVLGGLFIALIGISTYFGLNMANRDMFLQGNKEDTEEIAINTQSDTLYVDLKQVVIPQNFTAYDDDLYSDKKSVFKKDWADIEVTKKSNIKTPYLIIKKEAKGYNIPINLNVPVEIVDNRIILPNYIKYPYQQRFRKYRVEYELVIPENMVVIPQNSSISINRNTDEDDEDNIVIENDKISINGTSINYDSDDSDSIIVNGIKVSKKRADKVLDSLKNKIEKSSNGTTIKLKDGKDEISIKTK